MYSKIKLENSCFQVGDASFNVQNFKRIFVIGGGKAGAAMAQTLEEILDGHITAGLVNVPYGTKEKTHIVKLHEASHPVPDNAGILGTRSMMTIAEQAKEDDLVICLISGGGSSLMPLPREGITLEEKQKLTNALLKSGATINEINIVRKHLSVFKGGWLAKKAYPAKVLNIILSDVIGDPLDSIASGPTVPDSSTFNDARKILEKYDLWLSVSGSVHEIFTNGSGGLLEETPKKGDPVFGKVQSFIIGNNRTAIQATLESLKTEGLNTLLLPDFLEGEAKQIGKALAKFANGVFSSGEPLPKPLGVVSGGEATVTVTGKGLGGRNQEAALSAALNLNESGDCVIAFLSTDGIDGPTNAAGAIVDGCTVSRAIALALNPQKSLEENDSHSFFSTLGDLIITGATGTNVNDISVIIVL
jgi:glycerate-2-kinase